MISRHTIAIVTDASGDFSATIRTGGKSGRLLQYRYVVDATSPLDTGADIDLVGATTGLVFINQDNIGTSSFTKAPRQPTHDNAGAASLYAAGGEPVEDFIYLTAEDLTFTVAQGGNAKVGTLYLWFG